jgi:xanthine dehydrogenase FAD-binding subunit
MSTFLAPGTLGEALSLLDRPDPPAVLAGGTDLWPLWRSGQRPMPSSVLSLHRLGDLRRISMEGDLLRIGACCAHARIAASGEVRRACPAVAEAAATIGARQVQNRGTLGGNLVGASPAADLPPPLCAAGAIVELASASGVRRVPIDRFFLGYRRVDLRPGELLAAVLVPPLTEGGRERFRKVGTRRAQAISKVAGACRLVLRPGGTIASAAIALGSVAPTVVRLYELEQWLEGRAPDGDTAAEAGHRTEALVSPIDDLRSTADYRRYIVGQLVRLWILDLPPALDME